MLRVFVLLACLAAATSSIAQPCPDSASGSANRRVLALLDYIALNGERDLVAVAECSANAYRNVSLAAFNGEHPTRTEQLLQDVSSSQRRAADKLDEQGDSEGRDRLLRIEVSVRRKILGDLDTLDDVANSRLRRERVKQTTYMTQALERLGDGMTIHQLLASGDIDYFQPQVIHAWLRSLYSCPEWKLSSAGSLTDFQLKKNVCHPSCTLGARAALANIDDWRKARGIDWKKNGEIREMHVRLNYAIASCSTK